MESEVIVDTVFHMDNDSVTFPDVDGRAWEHAIHCDNGLGSAQPSSTPVLHLFKVSKNNTVQAFVILKKTAAQGQG